MRNGKKRVGKQKLDFEVVAKVVTELIKNAMTAFPPPSSNEKNDPNIVTNTFRFCLTMIQMESVTSSNVPIFVLIKLIKPCWAAEKSSLDTMAWINLIKNAHSKQIIQQIMKQMKIRKNSVHFVGEFLRRWMDATDPVHRTYLHCKQFRQSNRL